MSLAELREECEHLKLLLQLSFSFTSMQGSQLSMCKILVSRKWHENNALFGNSSLIMMLV